LFSVLVFGKKNKKIADRFSSLGEPFCDGPLGRTWRAVDTASVVPRTVVLKLVRPVLDDPGRARREAELHAIATRAHVPGIARLLETHTGDDPEVLHGGSVLLVVEYAGSMTLARAGPAAAAAASSLIDEPGVDQGGGSRRRVLEIAAQLFATLAALHAAGIAHGDVTPWNLVVADAAPTAAFAEIAARPGPTSLPGSMPACHPSAWRLRLIDFGLAQPILPSAAAPDPAPDAVDIDRAASVLTISAAQETTRAFRAPELLTGEQRGASPAADVWAAGCVLLWFATGRCPFPSSSSSSSSPVPGSSQFTPPPPPPPPPPSQPPSEDMDLEAALEDMLYGVPASAEPPHAADPSDSEARWAGAHRSDLEQLAAIENCSGSSCADGPAALLPSWARGSAIEDAITAALTRDPAARPSAASISARLSLEK
jgi:serine/threonine protein kinase